MVDERSEKLLRPVTREDLWTAQEYREMSESLSDADIAVALQTLPGWVHEGDRLRKTFLFGSFPEAISFILRVAFSAEQLDHHPEFRSVYNRVDIALCTHDAADRVTQRDVGLARAIQRISWLDT